MPQAPWFRVGSFALVALGLWGCSAQGDSSPFSDGDDGDSSGGGLGVGAAGSGGSGNQGGGIGVGGSGTAGSGGGDVVAEVFGHSSAILYKMDPTTKQVTVVGPFNGCSSVIDIAADKDGNLYGATSDGLYAIDKLTAACTLISSGGYPNSLSFVPAGTLDPVEEALVGYNGSQYVRIDKQTGAVSQVGVLSGGLFSSGDIVSVKNGKTLLTVAGATCGDCIVEVNPTTGDLVQNWGPLSYPSVYGLAFWAGSAYGFSDAGDLFEVQFGMNGITVMPIAIPNPPAGLSFWGAGSTTSAPPEPVPE